FVEALHNEVVSFEGEYWTVDDSQVIPFSGHRFRVVLGGTSDRTYDLAAKHGWAVAVPPLLPYAALKEQLDLYRAKCAEYGTTPDIIWIHACYLDDDGELAQREAERHMRGFLEGNASPLTEYPVPPVYALNAAGYGFYAAGIMEKLAATPYDEMIAGDIVWVGTPEDVIQRIRETIEVCEGLTEIAIMTIQNGLGAEEIVAAHGAWPLLSAVTFMSGTRHGDAHVEYALDTPTWIGPYRGTTEEDAREVAELLEGSGLKAQAFADLRPAHWSKLIFNATVNGVAALTGLPHDFYFAQTEKLSDLGHLVRELVDEGKAVAGAAGVELH